jgi:hypothetical protein
MDVQKIGLKPKTGAFVSASGARRVSGRSGIRPPVEMTVEHKFGGGADEKLTMDSVVLGAPTKFYP